MKIAGLQKLSLVDYPGLLSAVVFLEGCNFRCPYCYNIDLIDGKSELECPEEEVFEFLERRKNIVEAVVITGGEPTLHGSLEELIFKVRDLGYKIKLDTNGSDPRMLRELIKQRAVDYIALDIKTSPSKYERVCDLKEMKEKLLDSIGILLKGNVDHEMRTTCVPGIVEVEDFYKISKMVKGADKYFLQQFRSEQTFSPEYRKKRPFTKEELGRFKSILERTVDDVSIRGI